MNQNDLTIMYYWRKFLLAKFYCIQPKIECNEQQMRNNKRIYDKKNFINYKFGFHCQPLIAL